MHKFHLSYGECAITLEGMYL
ncbi:hypothetical protein Gotur_022614 [Gossypium turneri]